MSEYTLRKALPEDIEGLLRLEQACFDTDRLSRRSFRRWLHHRDCIFVVGERDGELGGYALVTRRQGTRLARLYSIAVDPASRGQGLASRLIQHAERLVREEGSLYMRLEVAEDNRAAIELYCKLGYQPFGFYRDYYEDHGDAVRMEKCIHPYDPPGAARVIPWVPQSTSFTCGPASLMMAMAALNHHYRPSLKEEIQIWREATTIFMTSGHGGCHPVGLALAAVRRGFFADVWINQHGPPFLDGVRSANKKRVMALVHEAFLEESQELGVQIHYEEVEQQQLVDTFSAGSNILILISTYRLDRKKTPHWVVLSGYDESCLYVSDPDTEGAGLDEATSGPRDAMECQHVPIARDDFIGMSRFGGSRLRTAVVLRNRSR
jgi:ribosomal protein S18 acetylase RimI-like enzyme